MPRACASQQENPLRWEALSKPAHSDKDPVQQQQKKTTASLGFEWSPLIPKAHSLSREISFSQPVESLYQQRLTRLIREITPENQKKKLKLLPASEPQTSSHPLFTPKSSSSPHSVKYRLPRQWFSFPKNNPSMPISKTSWTSANPYPAKLSWTLANSLLLKPRRIFHHPSPNRMFLWSLPWESFLMAV